MFAQVLYNKVDRPVVQKTSEFMDVVADDWFADAVAWAAAEGIVDGYGNGLFGSYDNITREQMVTMLWRFVGCPQPEESGATTLAAYTDSSRISGYAQEVMMWAVDNGIIHGVGGNKLNPSGSATRAQVAQIFLNFMANT